MFVPATRAPHALIISLPPFLPAPAPSPRKSLPVGNAKSPRDASVRPRNSRPSWLSLLPSAPATSPAPPSLLMGASSGLSLARDDLLDSASRTHSFGTTFCHLPSRRRCPPPGLG